VLAPTTFVLFFAAVSGCSRPTGSAPESRTERVAPARSIGAATRPSGVANGGGLASSSAVAKGAAKKWDFESDAVNAPPSGFAFGRTGRGRDGRWIVRADGGATVLAQVDADETSFRFPVAVANEPLFENVRVSVRCKMVSGEVDRACGLVARYTDQNNYLVTRANALENNVRLYTVHEGSRSEIASFEGSVSADTWHDYRFELRGDKLEVFWNGKRVIEHHDSTFTAAGRAGVWTKADSVTYFDDFVVEPL
jgi:hypothetical protein